MRHLLIFWILLTGSLALGQNSVQITVTALPPFDPFLQDYFYQPGKLQVLVRNTTATQLTIKLQASLTGDNGVEVTTLPGYQPMQPLVLQPLQARFLTVADVKNMVDLSQVSVQGFDRSTLLQGKALPEGEYQLCLQAIDLQTNRPLSPAETGCTRIPVRSVEPPILIAPLCDQDVKPQIPQNIVFTWAPPAGVLPSKVEYTLRIVELPLQEADPNVFIDAVVLPATGVEVKNLKINTFLYSVVQPALKPGRKYAWRVQARDPMGKLLFLNDGKSPVCSFQYGEIVAKSQKLDKPIVIVPKKPLTGPLIQAICLNGTSETKAIVSGSNSGTTIITTTESRTVVDGSGQVVTMPAGSTMVVAKGGEDALDGIESKTVTSGDVVLAGAGKDLVLSWIPAPALLTALAANVGTTDPAQVRTIVQNVPDARYEVSVFGAKGTGAFGFAIPAEIPLWVGSSTNEYLSMSPDSVGFPLKFGQRYWYRVRLVLPPGALAAVKTNLPLTDESLLISNMCTFVLQEKKPKYEDYVVSGVLRYQFQGMPGNFVAPNTDVEIRVSSATNHTGTMYGKSFGSQAFMAKSDANGVFRIRIPRTDPIGQLLAKTGGTADKKTTLYHRLNVISNYYQSPNKPLSSVTYSPDSLNIGLVLVNAYAYQLKVIVQKKFDKFFTDEFTGVSSDGKAEMFGASIKTNGYQEIDKSLTEPLTGIKIHLYRKTKPAHLPPVEGQFGLDSLTPLTNGRIPIAEGVTALETDKNGVKRAYVLFDRLLPTVAPGEEYYLQGAPNLTYNILAGTPGLIDLGVGNYSIGGFNATPLKGIAAGPAAGGGVQVKSGTLPGGMPGALNPNSGQVVGQAGGMAAQGMAVNGEKFKVGGEEFTAVEEVVSLPNDYFKSTPFLINPNASTYLKTEREYGLRTNKRPTSKLNGRLTYKWPNRPEKFALANMPFTVKIGYKAKNVLLEELGTVTPNLVGCGQEGVEVTTSFIGTPTMNTNTMKTIVLTTEDSGEVMAAGVTDANGYFSIDVTNLNQKGDLLVNGKVEQTIKKIETLPCDKGPKDINAEVDPKTILIGQLKKDLGYPADYFSSKDIVSIRSGGGEYRQTDLGRTFGVDKTKVQLEGNLPGYGVHTVNTATNATLNGTQPATVVPGVNAQFSAPAMQDVKLFMQGMRTGGGPWSPDELLTDPAADQLTVTRGYYIDIDSPFYEDAKTLITVDAFRVKDVGEITTAVKQWGGAPAVGPDGAPLPGISTEGRPVVKYANGAPVPGARVVIYRLRGQGKNPKHLPQLEGDGLMAYKPLPLNSRNQGAQPPGGPTNPTEAVDYYGEGFTDANGALVWNSAQPPLLLDPATSPGYYFYALPDSKQDVVADKEKQGKQNVVTGGYFTPIIQKDNHVFTVSLAPSRLIVRLLDPNKKSGFVNQDKFSQGLRGQVYISYPTMKGIELGYQVEEKDDGYLEIDLSGKWANTTTPTSKPLLFTISAYVPGYNSVAPVTFSAGYMGEQVVKELTFTAGASISGKVLGQKIDEKGNLSAYTGVQAFLIRADSSVYDTQPDGTFTNIAVPSSPGQSIVVRPRDPAYWDETVSISAFNGGAKPTIQVKRRQHRMKFLVVNKADGKPLQNIKIQILDVQWQNKDLIATTNAQGVATLDFENVSINKYRVQVDWAGSGLIKQVFELVNYESREYDETYKVTAEFGATITGIVTLDQKPIANARVYLDYAETVEPSESQQQFNEKNGVPVDKNDNGAVFAWSGDGGKFTLKGVPVQPYATTVRIRAVLGNGGYLYQGKTVIGASADVQLANKVNVKPGPAELVLNLTTDDATVVSVFGFPLSVEKLVHDPKDKSIVIVTGRVALSKSKAAFNWPTTVDQARIKDVKFKLSGNSTAIPQSTAIDLEGVSSMKFSYAKRYNVELGNAPGLYTSANPLQVVTDGQGRGQLRGKVQIVDNSFQYPSTYLNFQKSSQFFLSNITLPLPTLPANNSDATLTKPNFDNADKKITNTIVVLTALSDDKGFQSNVTAPPVVEIPYGLCGTDGQGINFTLLNFQATADPARSYIDPTDGKIHLNLWLDCTIPNAQPGKFAVNIDDLVLDNKNVYPKAGANPLRLGFENWTLEVKNWSLDPKQGGIHVEDASYNAGSVTMKTKQVDIPFSEFLLRPDIFRLGVPKLSDLNVAGLASLSVKHHEAAIFTYDASFDGLGHWKLSIPQVGADPAATLMIKSSNFGNEKILGGKPINFSYVQVLSNNQTIMTMTEGQSFSVLSNTLAGFTPTQFTSGSGYLNLAGEFKVVDAPRVPSAQMSIKLRANQAPEFKTEIADNLSFEVKGHAIFKVDPAATFVINKDSVRLEGTIREPGATPELKARFLASAGFGSFPYQVKVLKQTVFADPEKKTNLKIDVVETTGLEANKTDWQKPLVFQGELYQTGGNKAQLKKGQQGLMNFTVYGDMHVEQADTKGVKIEAIETPFGEVKLLFDFKTPRIVGSIKVADKNNPSAPLELGAFKVNGQGSFVIDSKGAYVVASLMALSDQIPPPIQGINLGVAIGYREYEPDAKVVLLGSNTDPLLLCKVGDEVKGLFVGAGVTLFHKEKTVPFVVGKAWFKADANLTASAKIDMSGTPKQITFSAGANANAEAGVKVLCASASVGLGVFGDLTGNITSNLDLCAAATVGVYAKLKVDACGFTDYTLSKYFALVGSVNRPAGGKVSFNFDIDTFDGPIDAGKCDNLCPCANNQ